MKIIITALASLIFPALAMADPSREQLSKLVNKVGNTFWGEPKPILVRATVYKKEQVALDRGSAQNKSDEKIGLRYATDKEAGTLAVPKWLPRGSLVKIHTTDGVYSFIAADQGPAVDQRTAAKVAGKTKEEKAAPVLDFCAEKQLWPDFVIVEVYYYAGKIPFSELSIDDQKMFFAYAMTYVKKRE